MAGKGVLVRLSCAFVIMVAAVCHALAGDRVNTDEHGVAIKGYDPVAYFTMGKPVKGSADYAFTWQDARWHFVSAEHRALFAGSPETYAPRYGGYCAGAMSLGRLWSIDPQAWAIVDDRLYLNFLEAGRDALVENPDPIIAKSDANWEQLRQGR